MSMYKLSTIDRDITMKKFLSTSRQRITLVMVLPIVIAVTIESYGIYIWIMYPDKILGSPWAPAVGLNRFIFLGACILFVNFCAFGLGALFGLWYIIEKSVGKIVDWVKSPGKH